MARMGERRGAYRVGGKVRERDNFEDLSIDGRTMLKRIFKNRGLGMDRINPLNAELNPICHLLTLPGGATIVVVSRLRVNLALDGNRWRAVLVVVIKCG